jgi:hypothetical protein
MNLPEVGFVEIDVKAYLEHGKRRFLYKGRVYTVKQLAEELDIKPNTLSSGVTHHPGEEFGTWLNNYRWKLHTGAPRAFSVAIVDGKRTLVSGAKGKHRKYVSHRPIERVRSVLKKKTNGYDPHDTKTYQFYLNGKYYKGSDNIPTEIL